MYPADGRKIPDIHTHPPELRHALQERLGTFPLFRFWGPAADLASTRWIAGASLSILEARRPSLTLVYLPHLDYDFQRHGPDDPRSRAALRDVDGIVGELAAAAKHLDANLLVVSEYGIAPVSQPVHLNRALRAAGLIAVREELGHERLDTGASRAFAVADHQIAHIYVRDPADLERTRHVLAEVPGVETLLSGPALAAEGLDHARSGELVAIAAEGAWFTYYFWLDDAVAPDYARTVDIHRKPGYDPVELFLDPRLRLPKLQLGRRLVAKKLGFRTLMDVIGLDATLVRGSHGRRPRTPAEGPLLLSSIPLESVDPSKPFPISGFPGLLASLSPTCAGA
jgi:predicted AlkP superfamily pyrophosphatase or phosphodiesterase